MPWAVPPPDLTPAALDLRPASMVIESMEENGVAAKIKGIADNLERETSQKRSELRVRMRSFVGVLTEAEFDGWDLDLTSSINTVERCIATMDAGVSSCLATLRRTVSRFHSLRVPGSNTLYTSENRVKEALTGFINDYDDILDELRGIQRRMRRYRTSPSPIDKARKAYQRALSKVLEHKGEFDASPDVIDGALSLRLTIPVPSALLSNADELLRLENMAHDEVALENASLIGRVSIEYIAAD